MSAAAPVLRRLQQAFRDIGINDDVQITGHVAFLLLVRDDWGDLRSTSRYDLHDKLPMVHLELQKQYPDLQHIPEPPPVRRLSEHTLASMIDLLEQAIHQSPHNRSLGIFFQREIRFEILKSTHGGQYPTPYHIAELMAMLGVEGMFADVFDPTAGSGGLLAAAYELNRPAKSTDVSGCEYDASWSALAAANILLHDRDEGATLILGSGLGYTDSRSAPFGTVLMNPPFSNGRPIEEVERLLGTSEYGTANVNVLTVKALQLLHSYGRAVILVPSGLLFGGGANARLRALLVRHRLEAVVTLDKECFQPFSNVTAHLVSVQKLADDAPPPAMPVWMCNVMSDGYPTGAGRDLTADPDSSVNELPRVRELILRARQATWPHALGVVGPTQVEALLLRPADGLAGAAMRCRSANDQIGWQITSIPSGVLMQVNDDQRTVHGVVHLPFRANANAVVATLSAETNAQMSWSDLLLANTWADALPSHWIGATDAIRLSVQGISDARTLNLQTGTGASQINVTFASTDVLSSQACILDSEGLPLSPWLSLQGDRAIMDDKAGARLQAWAVMDAHNERCGWLMALAEVQPHLDGGGKEPADPRTGWLLVVQPMPARFITASADHWAVLLRSLDNKGQQGWLHATPSNSNCVQIELGEPVVLRSDFRAQGFAIGPAPEPSSPAATVFGVLVPHAHLVPADGEPLTFEARTYLPEPPSVPVSHPSDVIARIRKNQARLGLRVDNLLQMIGGAITPPDTGDVLPPDYLHIDLLDARQRQIWDVIWKISDAGGRPRLFTLGELGKECKAANAAQSDTQLVQTLVLFLRLGLVVEVHTDQRNGYRRVSAADIVPAEAVSP